MDIDGAAEKMTDIMEDHLTNFSAEDRKVRMDKAHQIIHSATASSESADNPAKSGETDEVSPNPDPAHTHR